MSKSEWIARCQSHFAKLNEDYAYNWQDFAETCYESMFNEFKDAPEFAADVDMFFWR